MKTRIFALQAALALLMAISRDDERVVKVTQRHVDSVGVSVAGDVTERFAHDGRNLPGDFSIDAVEHTDEVQRGAKAQNA